jgi:hypothetical protein
LFQYSAQKHLPVNHLANSLISLTYTDQREKIKRYIIFTYLSGVLKTYHFLQEEEKRDKGEEKLRRKRRMRNSRRRRGRRIGRGGGR